MGGSGGGYIPSRDLRKLEETAKQSLRGASQSAPHVFISFAFEDENEVNLLRGQAKNQNTDFEFDDFSLKDAIKSNNEEYIKERIRERIDKASVTIVYLTVNSVRSKWVNWEIAESVRKGKGVIGVYQGTSPPRELPELFLKNRFRIVRWSHKELADAIEEARQKRTQTS